LSPGVFLDQGGNVPGPMANESLEQLGSFGGVIAAAGEVIGAPGRRRVHLARPSERQLSQQKGTQMLLLVGAGQGDTGQMLDAPHPFGSCLANIDCVGNVAGDGKPLLACLVEHGQERGARQAGIHLDEVFLSLFACSDLLAGLLGIGRLVDVRSQHPRQRRAVAVDHAVGHHQPGGFPVCRLTPGSWRGPGSERVHVPDPGDAVRQEHLAKAVVEDVDVHVPQPGDQVSTPAIEFAGAGRHDDLAGVTDRGNAVVLDEDGAVGPG
jgi:hypothetical protein